MRSGALAALGLRWPSRSSHAGDTIEARQQKGVCDLAGSSGTDQLAPSGLVNLPRRGSPGRRISAIAHQPALRGRLLSLSNACSYRLRAMTDPHAAQRIVLASLLDAHPRLMDLGELEAQLPDVPRVREALNV